MAKVNADRAKGIPQEGIKFQENRRSIGFNNPLLCAGVLCVYEYEYVCVCLLVCVQSLSNFAGCHASAQQTDSSFSFFSLFNSHEY